MGTRGGGGGREGGRAGGRAGGRDGGRRSLDCCSCLGLEYHTNCTLLTRCVEERVLRENAFPHPVHPSRISSFSLFCRQSGQDGYLSAVTSTLVVPSCGCVGTGMGSQRGEDRLAAVVQPFLPHLTLYCHSVPSLQTSTERRATGRFRWIGVCLPASCPICVGFVL